MRVVTGNGAGLGGSLNFTTAFTSNKSDGATVSKGNLGTSVNVNVNFGSSFGLNKGNLAVTGKPNAALGSGFVFNVNGRPGIGNLTAGGHSISTNQMSAHRHMEFSSSRGGQARNNTNLTANRSPAGGTGCLLYTSPSPRD